MFLGVAVFVFYRFPAFTLLPAGVAGGFLLYAAVPIQNRSVKHSLRELPRSDPRLPGVFTVAFLLALAFGVFSLSKAYYSKPLTYYLATAIAAGVLVLRVIFTDAHRSNIGLALLFGTSTFLSNQVAFPLGLSGPDIGVHIRLAQSIYSTGHIVGNTVYTGFPGQHVLAASVASAAGTEVAVTYRFLGVFGMLLGIPVAYLLAHRFVGRKYAPLGMIIYASMDYVVYRAGHPSKLAYALPLFLLVFTCVIYLFDERTPGMLTLFALFVTALTFTHHHTAFVALIMLSTLAFGQEILGPRIIVALSKRLAVPDGGFAQSLQSKKDSRGHVLPLLASIAFLGNLVYFSGFYSSVISIFEQYIDILFIGGGTEATKQTGRFAAIPLEQLLLNTIGTGLLAMIAIIGILVYFRNDLRLTITLFSWLFVAGMIMVLGVVANVPFALPQRVFVMTQLTGLGLFATVGIVALLQRIDHASASLRAPAALAVVLLLVGFVFFSTASTVAGIETSPFNNEVPYRTWYDMTEERSADQFIATSGINQTAFRWARGLPIGDDRRIDYSTVEPRGVFGTNAHRISTGIPVEGGTGRIGTGRYVFPQQPKAGLSGNTKIYDNGVIDLYMNTTTHD